MDAIGPHLQKRGAYFVPCYGFIWAVVNFYLLRPMFMGSFGHISIRDELTSSHVMDSFGKIKCIGVLRPICYGCIWARLKERSLLRPMFMDSFPPERLPLAYFVPYDGCIWAPVNAGALVGCLVRPMFMDSFGPIVGVLYVWHVAYFVPCLWIHLGPRLYFVPWLWIRLGSYLLKKEMSLLRPMLWIHLGLVFNMSHTIIAWLTSSQSVGFIWVRQSTPKRVELRFFDLLRPKQLGLFGSETTTQQTGWKNTYSILLSLSFFQQS